MWSPGGYQTASQCSFAPSLRDGEDPLVIPTSSEGEKAFIHEKYESAMAEMADPGLGELLYKLWELYKKYREKEDKTIERIKDQKDQITSQANQLEEVVKKIANYAELTEQKNKEILDIKKLVDASHTREQDSQETIEHLRGQIKKLETEIELKERMQAEMDAEMGVSGKTRESFNREKERMTSEILGLRKNIKTTNEHLSEIQMKFDKANTRVVELQAELNDKQEILTRLTKLKTIAENENQEAKKMIENYLECIKGLEDTIQDRANRIAKEENIIKDLEAYIERIERQNDELCKALEHEREEVYLTNCRIVEILETNEEYAKQFKVQEKEIVKLRKDVAANVNIQEVATRKVAAVEQVKDKVQSELEKAKYETKVKISELDNKERETQAIKRTSDSMLREKEILNKNILRTAEVARDNLMKYQLEAQLKSNLEVERDVYRKEMGKLRLSLVTTQKEKERLMSDTALLMNKIDQSAQDIRNKQAEIYDCKKMITELEIKVRQATNMFEAVRTERNNLSHTLIETKDQLEELRQKTKIVIHQIEQLKEDVATKEAILKNSEIVMRKVKSERDAIAIELKRVKEALKLSKLSLEKKAGEEIKMKETIDASEKRNGSLQREINKAVTDCGLLATQLDRRSSELSLMYEKIELMQTVLARGDEQYTQRIEDIKVLKLEVKKIRNEKELLKKSFDNMADLRKEIYHLNRDLLNERQKCQVMEEEMQTPTNYHRWRILEGTDPEKKQLIEKMQVLQKKITKFTDDEAVYKANIRNLTELYDSAVEGLKKLPGLEIKHELEKARNTIREKDTQLKVFTSEIKVCEEQLELYKIEVKNLKIDLNDVKKKFYARKLKDDKRKQKEMDDNFKKTRADEESKLQKLALGGGFSLLQGDKPV